MQEEEERRPRRAVEETGITVSEACESLRRKLSLEGARKSYLTGLRSVQEVQIGPRLGERTVTKVKTSDVEALASAMLTSGLKQKSVHNVLVVLNGVFEYAIERGWSNENPVRRAAQVSHLEVGAALDLDLNRSMHDP